MAGMETIMGGIFGAGLTPEQIFEQITTGPGATSVGNASHAANGQSELQDSINGRVRKLQELMGTGWTGDAAARARNAATPVAGAAEESTAKLRESQALLDMQSSAYEHVRNRVVPMPPNPGQPDLIDSTFPILTDHAEKQAAYNAAARNNNEAFDGYHSLSGDVGTTMPSSYGSLNADTAATQFSLKVPESSGPPLITEPKPGGPSGPGNGGGDGGPRQPSVPVGGGPGSGVGGSDPVAGGDIGRGAYQPPPAPGPGPDAGNFEGFDDTTSASGFGVPGGPSVPGLGNPSGFADLGGIKAGTTGFGGTTGTPGSGSGGWHSIGGALPGSGPGAPGSGTPGSRGGLGAGKVTGGTPATGTTGGAAPTSSSTSGGASRGSARPPMMGTPGAGKGQGGEDKEHQRPSYLEESDPDGVFIGDLPNITPAVIGVDRPKPKDK